MPGSIGKIFSLASFCCLPVKFAEFLFYILTGLKKGKRILLTGI